MLLRFPHLILFPGLLFAAAPQFRVDEAKPGGQRIVVSFDDSIKAPDLLTLRLNGYGIEHVAFVEESDSMLFSPDLVDLTEATSPRIIHRKGTDSTALLLESKVGWVPRQGLILSDTAQGGLLVKIVSVLASSEGPNRFWVQTIPAFLNEAVFHGSFRFRMRMDMNAVIPDYQGVTEVLDHDSGANGELSSSLTQGKILFQPVAEGVIQFHNGLLQKVEINVQGEIETSGSFSASVSGTGHFTMEHILPKKRIFSIPLGHGLTLKVSQSFVLSVETNSRDEEFSGNLSMRVRNAVSAKMSFNINRWQPSGVSKEISSEKPEISVQGHGTLQFSLEPRLEFGQNGQPGPSLTISSVAKISDLDTFSISDTLSTPLVGGRAWLRSALFLRTPPLSTHSDPQRDFLFFNRERVWAGPPQMGWASVVHHDTIGVTWQCQTDPVSSQYKVERLSPSGKWEAFPSQVNGSRIRVVGLRPGQVHKIRFLGSNAYGFGPPFPLDGFSYLAPTALLPLPMPQLNRLDSVVQGDSGIKIHWSISKPLVALSGVFNVYLGLDSLNLIPVAQSLRDTQVWVPLDSGKAYFVKLEYVEGSRFASTGLQRFVFISNLKKTPVISNRNAEAERLGMAFIPKGSFKRADGKTVMVGPFYIQRFEVTQLDFKKASGTNPSFHVLDSLPVDRVTWDEASNYCTDLGGRLPTEAEWEFAARAGSRKNVYWGEASAKDFARFRDNSLNRTWVVGLLKPNGFGLYDMLGNVFEWTQDWFGEYSTVTRNPKGSISGEAKVIRGASWYSDIRSLDLSARFSNRPGFRNYKVGFRCAMDAVIVTTLAATPAP